MELRLPFTNNGTCPVVNYHSSNLTNKCASQFSNGFKLPAPSNLLVPVLGRCFYCGLFYSL